MNNLIEGMSTDERYHKNVLYITPEQQDRIKQTRIVFGGVGLASVLAESAMRMGFERFVFIDGDDVEMSNLNRQNYEQADIGNPKVTSLVRRLEAINPNVEVTAHNLFLNPDNIEGYVDGCDIAVNAIDFDVEDTPFAFDQVCRKKGIPIIHPLNLGWAGAAFVVTPESEQVFDISRNEGRFELSLIESILNYLENRNDLDLKWFYEFYENYKKHSEKISPPQLSVGSFITAGLVTNILFSLVNSLEVKTYPDLYFLSSR
ncbi:MAG: ThiF family adenylyltransferase [Bacteroidota bacterium]